MSENGQTEHRFSNRKEVRQEVLAMAETPDKTNGKTVEEPKRLNLAQKIREIQNSVGVIKKRGKHAQGWSYLMIEDAVLSVNKLMAAQGLILTGSLAKRQDGSYEVTRTSHHDKGYICDAVMDWTLEDVETGEKRVYQTPGSGFDSTDKGIYKAETGSRKYTIINVFNLPVGDNPEASTPSREEAKSAAKAVGDKKVAEAAGRGSQTAIDAISQIEPEKKVLISRPDEHNGNYIVVTGMIAVPQLERFFDDTGSKRFKTKADLVPYWRVPSEYEKGLIALCQKLGIEVEG